MSQRLNAYFSTNQELRQLSRRAQVLATLQRQYQEAAPAPLAGASRVIGFEHRILTLGADNGAVAAKLRQITPQLVEQLQANGAEVTGIRVKVQVANILAPRKPVARSISAAAQQQVAGLAANLPDSPLKSALQRLARRGKQV